EFVTETEDITHHATVPLRSGNEQFGLLNVATPFTTHYSDEDLELLESVAFQIGSAIKRIDLNNQEKEAARINERNRLARDLHDSVNQMLFSLKLTAHAAGQMTQEETSKRAFMQIEQTSQNAVNEMRALIWQLKPVGLEKGLVHALKNYASLIGLDIDVTVKGLIDLENKIETHLYRVMQEAMNNTKKHAQTNHMDIVLNQTDVYLIVELKDNGIGFDVTQVDSAEKHGLSNMRQRIKFLKGTIKMASDQGTKITIQLPLQQPREGQ
ncbi:GAF domain-containing sensor histidine kinase, partial [Staphylococcus pseudintermedius]